MKKPEQMFGARLLRYNGFASRLRVLLVTIMMSCTHLLFAQRTPTPPNLLIHGDFEKSLSDTSSNSIFVVDCDTYALHFNDTIKISTTWAAADINNPYTNSNFEAGTVAGSLVIDNNSTLTIGSTTGTALTMLMNPESKIIVKSGSHLILNNVTLRSATIAPCAGLWQGIVVEAGGQLTMNNAKIYDARIGVDYQGNGIVISNGNERRLNISGNSVFDKNGISVRIGHVRAESVSEAFKITNTTFNHNTNPALPNVDLGTRIGVLLDSASLQYNSATYFTGNTFNGGDIQVKLYNAQMQVIACTLTNARIHAILATTNHPENGHIVYIYNNTIKNTNGLSTQIALTGGMAGEINSNTLEGAGQDAILYRANKFSFPTTLYRLIIYGNTIKYFGQDNVADRAGIFLNDNLNASVLVDRNTITGTSASYAYSIGLRVDMHYMPDMSYAYSVDTRVAGANSNNISNTFKGVRMGVGCKNTNYVNLSNNAISWDATNANATDRYGIWLEYVKNYVMRYNRVSQTQLMSTNAIGMGIFWSTDADAIINNPFPNPDDLYPIRYNTFTKLNTAVILRGHNFSARKTGSGNQRICFNTITDCTEGFRLAATMLFTQTSLANGTSTQSAPNTFTNTPIQWTVFADNLLGGNAGATDINTQYNPYSKWYPTNWCNRTVKYYNQENNYFISEIPSNLITTAFLLQPSTIACPIAPDTTIQTARVAAGTEETVVLDSASRWNQRYFTLSQEDSTTSETTPADRFTRRMLRAEKLLHQGRYEKAQQLLALMQPLGLVEQTHKKVLMHYLAYNQAKGKLSPPAIEELKLIAAQNPAHAGTGVFLANGLLASSGYSSIWTYHYQPLPIEATVPEANRIASAAATVSIWPNPVRDILHINSTAGEVSHISLVYALTGQKVLEQSLRSDASLNVSGLRKGLYYYQINVSDGSPKTGMLSIE